MIWQESYIFTIKVLLLLDTIHILKTHSTIIKRNLSFDKMYIDTRKIGGLQYFRCKDNPISSIYIINQCTQTREQGTETKLLR